MTKYIIIIITIILKSIDLYITYKYAFQQQILYETSLFIAFYDLSFNTFLFINIFFLVTISILFLKYDVKNHIIFKKEKNLQSFISKNIFYKDKIIFNDLLKIRDINNKLLFTLLIYSLPNVLIINALIAVFVNFFLIFGFNLSDISNFIVSNNLFFIINVIIIFISSYFILNNNFKKNVR